MCKANQHLLEDGNQYYTAENVNINKRLQSGVTFGFTCYKSACVKADLLGSYVYELFSSENRNDKRPEFYGWAVPK